MRYQESHIGNNTPEIGFRKLSLPLETELDEWVF